tara:strand:- start:396 stop:1040 length:645 start_codon:yes stop_codon:yes gene_type:complete
MTTTTKPKRPDSDFKYRIVSGYDGHRLTWHSLECNTGRKAKYSARTGATPEERKAAIKAKRGYEPYYTDHMARCCLGDSKAKAASPTFTKTQARQLFREAQAAGLEAGNNATPTPMIVGTPTTPFSNDIDPEKNTYFVADGVCGFARVVIKPGNSSLANHAKRLGIGHSNYYGGVGISIHDHGQSLDRKSRHARAYAKVLQAHGVDAMADSRID